MQVSDAKLGYVSRNDRSEMKSGLHWPAAGSPAGQDGPLALGAQEPRVTAGQRPVQGAGQGQGVRGLRWALLAAGWPGWPWARSHCKRWVGRICRAANYSLLLL